MGSEWIIVAVIGLILLFSAKKLPDMARGLGQSMRIFKAETKSLREDGEKTGDAGEAASERRPEVGRRTPDDGEGDGPSAGGDRAPEAPGRATESRDTPRAGRPDA